MSAIAIIIVLVIVLIAGYYGYQAVAKQQKKPSCPSGQSCRAPPPSPGQPQVYLFDVGRYGVPPDAAPVVADMMGAEVATYDQLVAAQKAGAEWCHYGFVNTGTPASPKYVAYYPMQTTTTGCGSTGVNGGASAGASYGVTLYGPKPPEGAYDSTCETTGVPCVMPWDTTYFGPNTGS